MYTLVLMAALSSAPEAASFNGVVRDSFFGRTGNGCNGTTRSEADDRSSCCGGCYGSCHGIFGGRIRNFFSFRGGCCGGSCHGDTRDHRDRSDPRDRLVNGRSSTCHGSSCQGSGLASAMDRGNSCLGSTYTSCHGSASLPVASCYGLGLGSITPTYPGIPDMNVPGIPGGYAVPGPAPSYSSYGMPLIAGPYVLSAPSLGSGWETPASMNPAGSAPRVMPTEKPMTPPSSGYEDRNLRPDHQNIVTVGSANANRGTVHVRFPVDAKLYAEGRLLTASNGEKTFVTPPLPADREAVYTFRVEYLRDGEVISQSKKVSVRAGGKASVAFDDLLAKGTATTIRPPEWSATSTATGDARPSLSAPVMPSSSAVTIQPPPSDSRAKITVKLPAGASLYVDGQKNERTELVREFTTPALKSGESYSYRMRTLQVKNGIADTHELKVEFKAGMSVLVDFTNLANPIQNRDNLHAGK